MVLKRRKEDHVLHCRGWAWARVRPLPQAARLVLAGGEGAGAGTLPSGHPVSCGAPKAAVLCLAAVWCHMQYPLATDPQQPSGKAQRLRVWVLELRSWEQTPCHQVPAV